MKKILLLTSNYYPHATANGVCIHKVASALKDIGYEVHLICFRSKGEPREDEYLGIKLYRVDMPLYFKINDYSNYFDSFFIAENLKLLSRIIKRLKLLIYYPYYPVTSLISNIKFYRLSSILHKKHKFDIVPSSYNPIESVIAGYFLKKNYGDIKFALYILDSFSNTGGGKFISKDSASKMGWKWEKRLYNTADKIFNMKAHEQHHQKNEYSKFRNKLEFVDIPLLSKLDTKNISQKKLSKEYITLVYTGFLDSKLRNPNYLCTLVKNIDDDTIRLNFYSRGNCESLLKEYEEKTRGIIKRKGYVTHSESMQVINATDILVNIGNSGSEMVPSKVFEYMSTGKPIIHVFDDPDDSSINYLSKYPLALLIKQDYNEIESNSRKVKEFIYKNSNKLVSFDKIVKLFTLNTPEYTANKIDEMLDE